MAELAFPLAAKLIERLSSIASEEICLAWGVQADLQKLGRTVSIIKDVLVDAQEKQARNGDLRSWLQQLKDVFLDAEDLLDEFECEALRRQVVRGGGTTRKVRRFFSSSNPVAFRLRVGHGIKDIRERLHDLKDDKKFADLRPDHHHHPHLGDHVRENMNTTHSFVRASEVIGRETEKNKIVDLLMIQGDDHQGGDNGRNVSVIPIVGLGGLGKTTLAQSVYNDQRVVGSFDLRMWQHVSMDFDVTRLTKEILGSALGTQISEGLSLDQLQAQLRDALKDKKFLLVLDDVWNEDRTKWTGLRNLLIERAKVGTKILVTTRNISVASVMGPVVTYINLEVLSFEDCMKLFVKCAFDEGQERKHPSLYEIGEDIVRKCGGIPLAVKTLGSQLYSKIDGRQWELIRDSEIWELEREGDGHILPALRLSYTQLPSHLKQCLASCSLLPKNYVQFVSLDLISQWMALGILESREHGDMELEDVGELYFKELWNRSFFQNVKDYSLYHKFDMHDLIHDLVQSVAQGESFTVDFAGTKGISENVRHLTILKSGQNVSTTLQKFKKVRTVRVWSCKNIDESFLSTCISRFKYLRVLSLFDSPWELLPSSIGSLKHLRRLDLGGNERITALPNSICKLQSLQTLNFYGCVNLKELPRDVSMLISLRHLHFTTKQSSFPENGVGCLTSLRILYIQECSKLTCLPRDTSYLASLRTLIIDNCKQLDLVMENYQVIPLRLQKLGIRGVPRMVALPEWFQGATNTLQVLVISDCEHGNMELEDVGELYFKELWDRSFFQNVKDYGLHYIFDMHDLIKDLVQSVAQGESFTVDSAGTKGISENVRHLTILEIGQNVSTTLQKFKKVRTIRVWSCKNIDESFLSTCISRFKYLRVLDFSYVSFELLPSSIGSLKHLRSLTLAGNERITALPNSICKLQSLQTLTLGECVNLEELPRDVSKLISLRWLELTTKQSSFPENGVGCLTSLRSLFIRECSNLTCLPRDTSYLASLHTLIIVNCKQLDLVMENYQVIPLRLQKLGIVGVPRMVALPEWFQGATNTLQGLVIQDCENLKALPGWLTSFTSLRKLAFNSCPKLLSLPEEMHRLTALTEVRIVDCPDLERRCQRDTGEDWPKISHVPNVSFERL